jgi:DNA-directed RNA polymerase specialized sigma24 family protein
MCELRHPECQRLFLRQVDCQAQRLSRRYNLQPADRDDVFQEIALDAWRRLTRYRANRGDLEPFLGLVTLNQARKIEARFGRRRACPEVSLDTPIVDGGGEDGDLTLEDSLTEDDGLPALLGNVVDQHTRVELMLDLSSAIARLPSEMRRLCACLAHETPGIARRSCGLSNTGMYRRIEELRLHFKTFGLATS